MTGVSRSNHYHGIGGRRLGSGRVDHPLLGPNLGYELTPVESGGDIQTADVISLMRRYALEDSQAPVIQSQARRLRESALAGGNQPYEAAYWWVKSRLRFVQDRHTAAPVAAAAGLGDSDIVVETLIRPQDMADLPDGFRVGDCDDYSMYLASLLTALGYRVWYATLAADPSSRDYSHVYVVIRDDAGNRIPLDASHGPAPGWEAPEAGAGYRYREWALDGGVSAWGVVILLIGAWWLCKSRFVQA